MLASHNTLTFLSPRHFWARLFSRWWRCQDKNLTQQYNAGVRHYDIRVRFTRSGWWQPCHGIVDLGKTKYYSLYQLMCALKSATPKGASFTLRIIHERGGRNDQQRFEEEVKMLHDAYPFAIIYAAIKKPWRDVLRSCERCGESDFYMPLNTGKPWWKQLGSIISVLWTTPRSYARKHPIKDEYRSDDLLHFYDFV